MNISLKEEDFVRNICLDLDKYVEESNQHKIFVFPPLSSRLRFIIHQTVNEEYRQENLTTFSVGKDEKRRTVVCRLQNLKGPVAKKDQANHRMPEQDERVQDGTVCNNRLQDATVSNSSSSQCRARRPDIPLYVPRAQRSRAPQKSTAVKQPDSTVQCSADKSFSKKRTTKKEYAKRESQSPIAGKVKKSMRKVVKSQDDGALVPSANCNADICVSGPADATICKVGPSLVKECATEAVTDNEEIEQKEGVLVESGETGNIIICEEIDPLCSEAAVGSQKLDVREEISRNETLVEQLEGCVAKVDCCAGIDLKWDLGKPKDVKQELSETVKHGMSVPSGEKCDVEKVDKSDQDKSWDSLFDETGDCLDPDLIEELSEAVCSVNIQKPEIDYYAFRAKDPEISDEDFGHIVEIYGFPAQFKTEDLISALSPFRNSGYDIKWVDDTHALGVFPSHLVASDVLATDHPMIKTRPLSQAIKASKMKAKHCSEFLMPYKKRPETSATLARRLVTGFLGLTTNVSKQQREVERRKLQDARARKKLVNKQREAAWDGTLGDLTLDTPEDKVN